MKIHEYQAKELLKKFGVPVPRGIVAHSPDEAYQAAKELACVPVVVKAQIHAGGRGKGGGVKLAKSPEQAREIARAMLGMKLVTHQTGPEGREVRVLLVEEGLPIDKEFYLGIVLDRASGRPVFMASAVRSRRASSRLRWGCPARWCRKRRSSCNRSTRRTNRWTRR